MLEHAVFSCALAFIVQVGAEWEEIRASFDTRAIEGGQYRHFAATVQPPEGRGATFFNLHGIPQPPLKNALGCASQQCHGRVATVHMQHMHIPMIPQHPPEGTYRDNKPLLFMNDSELFIIFLIDSKRPKSTASSISAHVRVLFQSLTQLSAVGLFYLGISHVLAPKIVCMQLTAILASLLKRTYA